MEHGCMVYTEHAETAAVSCGTSHASTVSTPLRWTFKKTRCKKLVIHVESITCEHLESDRDQKIAPYKSDKQTTV